MTSKVQFTFWIDPELRQYVNDAAWENRMSMSAYIAMLIKKDKEEKGDKQNG